MKTYLVPIDFSEAGRNTAHFAAELSKQTNTEDIILMNAYYISPYEDMLPNPDMVMLREQEIEENAAERLAQLEDLKAELLPLVRDGVKIRTKLYRGHLLRGVVDTVEEANVDVVFIGSKGNSSLGETGLGSHVVKVSKASPVPVIVVPPTYNYKLIDKAVIACDFKQVTENMPMQVLHKLLGSQQIKLMVVNVDQGSKHVNGDDEQLAEETALHAMLKAYHPKYYYVNSANIIQGINDFAFANDARMVIALPHKYSFLQSLIHSSVSSQLVSNASVPVLLLK